MGKGNGSGGVLFPNTRGGRNIREWLETGTLPANTLSMGMTFSRPTREQAKEAFRKEQADRVIKNPFDLTNQPTESDSLQKLMESLKIIRERKNNLIKDITIATDNYKNKNQDIATALFNTTEESINKVLSFDSVINRVATELNIKPALIQAILYQEIRFYNFADPVGNSAVLEAQRYLKAVKEFNEMPVWQQILVGSPSINGLLRYDVSTGLGQIFAGMTAIPAINWYEQYYNGRTTDVYDAKNKDNVFEVWNKLYSDDEYNIEMVGKVLLYKASLMGLIDDETKTITEDLNEAELKRLFYRYNGLPDINGEFNDTATKYGNAVYEYYFAFKKYNKR